MVSKQEKFNAAEVARIARLELAESELKKMESDLKSIIKAFGDLDNVNADCEPSFQPIPMKNVVREDTVEKSLSQAEALSGTIHKERGFFKGPKAI